MWNPVVTSSPLCHCGSREADLPSWTRSGGLLHETGIKEFLERSVAEFSSSPPLPLFFWPGCTITPLPRRRAGPTDRKSFFAKKNALVMCLVWARRAFSARSCGWWEEYGPHGPWCELERGQQVVKGGRVGTRGAHGLDRFLTTHCTT